MGYTHYMEQTRALTEVEWSTVLEQFEIILANAEKAGIEFEVAEKSDEVIAFNGVGDDSHETGFIERRPGNEFNFCKTARKPYDAIVVALYAVIKEAAPDAIDITSDGPPEVFDNPKLLEQE